MTICSLQRGILWGLAMVALFAAGCGKSEKETVGTRQAAAPQSRADAMYDRPAPAVPAVNPEVRILPESPTAEDRLEAVLSGANGPVTWRWEKNGKVMEGATSSTLQKGSFARGDEIKVIAGAGGGEAQGTVKISNSLPRVESMTLMPARLWTGVDITAVPKGTDADGDQVEFHYQWTVNREEVLMSDSPILKGDKLRRGDSVSVKITPADGKDDGKAYVTRPLVIPNAPPRFTSVPPSSFQGHVYTYQAVAEDPDGDLLSYSLVAAPHGMTIDSRSGKIEWKLSKESAGIHTVEVAVKDPEGLQAVQKFTITISIP